MPKDRWVMATSSTRMLNSFALFVRLSRICSGQLTSQSCTFSLCMLHGQGRCSLSSKRVFHPKSNHEKVAQTHCSSSSNPVPAVGRPGSLLLPAKSLSCSKKWHAGGTYISAAPTHETTCLTPLAGALHQHLKDLLMGTPQRLTARDTLSLCVSSCSALYCATAAFTISFPIEGSTLSSQSSPRFCRTTLTGIH